MITFKHIEESVLEHGVQRPDIPEAMEEMGVDFADLVRWADGQAPKMVARLLDLDLSPSQIAWIALIQGFGAGVLAAKYEAEETGE